MKGGFSSIFGNRRPSFGNRPVTRPILTPQFHAVRRLTISFLIVAAESRLPLMPFALVRVST